MSIAWPWIFATLALALVGIALALWLAQRRSGDTAKLPQEWPLSARPVFSSDERRAYRHLHQVLPEHLLLAKLPLTRFCQPTNPDTAREWFRLLGSAQISFAVCTPQGRVLMAIDLESRRTPSPRGARTQEIKRRALMACDIPYERWNTDHLPSAATLHERLLPHSGATASRLGEGTPSQSSQSDAAVSVQSMWRDSGYFKSSTFDADMSAFGLPALGRAEARGSPDDIVGIVVDTPPPVLRH
jgi:Protein of unknown function (DUF2726)